MALLDMNHAALIDELSGLLQKQDASDDHRRALPDRQGQIDTLLRELRVYQTEIELQNRALREGQSALELSRSRFEELYDFAPIAYCTLDERGCIQEVNLTCAKLLGLDRAKLFGLPFLSVAKVTEPSLLWSHLRRCTNEKRPVTTTLQLSTATSEALWVQAATSPVFDAGGMVVAFRTSLTDVSALKEMEARLGHSSAEQQRLRERFEDLDRSYLRLNKALAREHSASETTVLCLVAEEARRLVDADYAAVGVGTDPKECFAPWAHVGMSPEDAVSIGSTPRPCGVFRLANGSDQAVRIPDVHEHPAFEGFPPHHPQMTSFMGIPLRTSGETIGSLYVCNKRSAPEFSAEDQTALSLYAERAGVAIELERLRGEVDAAREHFEFALAGADMAAWDWDLRSGHVRFGAGWAKLRGLDPQDVSPTVETWERGIHPEDRAAVEQQIAEFLAGRSSEYEAEYRVSTKSGEWIWILDRGKIFARDENGKPLRMVGTEFDISARKLAEQNLRSALVTRDNLLAIVTHDLRTPLSAILLSSEVLEDRAARQGQIAEQGHFKVIHRSIERMTTLIDDLLEAATMEAGLFSIDVNPEETNSLLEEALDAIAPLSKSKGIELRRDFATGLPAVRCDRRRVSQVLANLVGNAIKFVPRRGHVAVGARQLEDEVIFSVRDSGPGIAPEQLEHLFDRFWKGNRTERQGVGLGLFIAKGIIDAHCGRIWVESELGRGTTFHFALKVA